MDDEEDVDKSDDEAKSVADGADADKMDTDTPAKPKPKPTPAKPAQRYRFSHFFKALTVEFHRSQGRTGPEPSVEWKKPDRTPASANLPAAADFDEFTFKRSGDENVNITINLHRDETPPNDRYELSPALADVVDMNEGSRPEIIMGLWEYIKLMNLQEDEEKRNFRCDDLLKKVPFLFLLRNESIVLFIPRLTWLSGYRPGHWLYSPVP